MTGSFQRGAAHILLMIILLAGLVFGVYLIQQRTNLFSKAFVSAPVGNPNIDFITVNGSSKNNQLDFTWTWPSAYTKFAIRLDEDPHSYDPTNLSDLEVLNDNYSKDTLIANCNPGRSYRLWVHGVDSSGKLSSEVGEQTLVCQGGSNNSCPDGNCPPKIMNSESQNGKFSVSWSNPGQVVDHFALRVDKDPDSYNPFNLNPDDVLINDHQSKEYTQSCINGSKYRFWVHAVSPDGRYSDVDEVTLTCGGSVDKPVLYSSPYSCPVTTRSYGQCGGTTGLEDYPVDHTIEVTETTDCNGQKTYSNKDLLNRGECPQ